MFLLHRTATAALTFAAIFAIATTELRAQEPPKKEAPPVADWDEISASLAVKLLVDQHIGLPQVDRQKELTIAVIGDSRFGRAFAAIAAGKKTSKPQQAPFRIVTVAEKNLLEEKAKWTACSVVVFATDDPKATTQALAIMAGKPSLLIGRTPGFVAAGGHLNFWLSKDNKTRYQLDHKAALKIGIKLSSTVVKSSRTEEAR